MEITASTIYWIAIADNISIALALGGIFFALITLICLMIAANGSDLSGVVCSVISFIFSLCLFTGWVFAPNSKTRAAMEILPAIVNNEQLQGVTKNALELTDEFLQDLLSEQIKKKGKAQ